MTTNNDKPVSGHSADIIATVVAQFARRESATVEDVLALARQLPLALAGLQDPIAQQNLERNRSTDGANGKKIALVPVIPPSESVSDETVTCLCCGKSFTMLKRHLKAEHGLTEEQYRAQFALADDHPLVAPNYSQRKAEYAKRIGLGKYTRDDASEQGTTATT